MVSSIYASDNASSYCNEWSVQRQTRLRARENRKGRGIRSVERHAAAALACQVNNNSKKRVKFAKKKISEAVRKWHEWYVHSRPYKVRTGLVSIYCLYLFRVMVFISGVAVEGLKRRRKKAEEEEGEEEKEKEKRKKKERNGLS